MFASNNGSKNLLFFLTGVMEVRSRTEKVLTEEILKQSGQVIKGVWRISRCQEAMKGVEDCDKPGEAVKRALIPGFLNYCTLNS